METEDIRLDEQPNVDPAFGILPEDAVFNFYQSLEELADASSFEPLILENPPEGFRFTAAYHQTSPTEVLTTFYERASEFWRDWRPGPASGQPRLRSVHLPNFTGHCGARGWGSTSMHRSAAGCRTRCLPSW